jgi:probable HAF family extracellular repeat protein
MLVPPAQPAASQPPALTIIDLTGVTSEAFDINDQGQVVGFYDILPGSFAWHAFVWQNGSLTDLGTLGGSTSAAFLINNRGQIVGTSEDPSGEMRIVMWEQGTISQVGPLAFECGDEGCVSTFPVALNDRGQTLLLADALGQTRSYLWEAGVATDLGNLGGNRTFATAINERGQVVGYSTETEDGVAHGFLWQDGTMAALVTLGGATSYAEDINDRGQIVGKSETDTGEGHAFLTQAGAIQDIGNMGFFGYPFLFINEAGQVAGTFAFGEEADSHAFL